jgi:hypothetical protein
MILVDSLLADAQHLGDLGPRPAAHVGVLHLRSLEHLEQPPQRNYRLKTLARIPRFLHPRSYVFVDASTIVDKR